MKHACHQATILASNSLDRPLSLWERIKLKLHLSMCSNCNNCYNNMKFIDKIHKLMRESDYGHIRLSEQQREALRRALEKNSTPES